MDPGQGVWQSGAQLLRVRQVAVAADDAAALTAFTAAAARAQPAAAAAAAAAPAPSSADAPSTPAARRALGLP